MKVIIANSNPIHLRIEDFFMSEYECLVIREKDKLTLETVEFFSPDYIFFLHWSHLIPKEIHSRFECVVFHMTDLPFGRGGSPLQNLIDLGVKETKLTALKVNEGLDTGDIYIKKKLSLYGTAEEIFLRIGHLIKEMILEIIKKRLTPYPQVGKPTVFKRRKPEQSNISEIKELENVYDYIRMLDAPGYPPAFFENDYFRFEFSRASLKSNEVIADVRIVKK